MKRFYCTVCKRVKRVRNYPVDRRFEPTYHFPAVPEARRGVCNKHHDMDNRVINRKVAR